MMSKTFNAAVARAYEHYRMGHVTGVKGPKTARRVWCETCKEYL
ncbi:hypothetical protein MYRNA_237 [Mycobacterium phage Myrna]|uniref:Uncharacterized protein n=1 Tax=Mycobacterium phage Myrna TaxID=546805 RepID=B5LJK7_9CAUD|nr:gp237 [Mycobacterium phage Myrna]ACH62204.1 hypothetical protein MYRNA_237 [Mycobacterium phage Myrna]